MLRNRSLALFILVLTLVSAGACLAVYPKPDGCVSFDLSLGCVDDEQAWYICTDASDFKYALDNSLTYAPKLNSAWGIAAPAYVVTNPLAAAHIVFSAKPGDPDYSGIWTLVHVTWTNLLAREPLTSEAEILAAQLAGDLTITPSDPPIVVDYPIVALGQLGGSGSYLIPQATKIKYTKKQIYLPTYDVNCEDEITNAPLRKKVIITDVGDPALATLLGANLAPGLLAIDAANEQRFWVRRGPKPPAEIPTIEFCPNALSYHNSEIAYSPVMIYTILHSLAIPPSTSVTTKDFLLMALANGCLGVVQDDQVINAPVLPPKADIEICAYSIKMYLFDFLLPDKDKVTITLNGRPVVTNFQLPVLLKPACIPLILRQGDNVVKIRATDEGKLCLIDVCTLGIAFSDPCPEFCNDIIQKIFDVHLELFALRKNECCTIVLRTP